MAGYDLDRFATKWFKKAWRKDFDLPAEGFQVFVGHYFQVLDAANRLVLPSKFRDSFRDAGGRSVIASLKSTAHASFLSIQTPVEWERDMERIDRVAQSSEEGESYHRITLWDAVDIHFDKQFRLVLPERLKAAAGLVRDIVVAGEHRSVVVWDSTAWKAEYARLQAQAAVLKKALYRGGAVEAPRGQG